MAKFCPNILLGFFGVLICSFILPTTVAQMPNINDILSALRTTMGDIDNSKMFYNPSEDTWEVIDYHRQMNAIGEYENVLKYVKMATLIPKVDIFFKYIGSFMDFVGSITSKKNELFWNTITAAIDKAVLLEKMSSMNAVIEAFKSRFEHLEHESVDFAVGGFDQIEAILAYFSEPTSLLRKCPLHSSPILLQFIPIMKFYVEYVAKLHPGIETDWRSIVLNKGMFLLELYKKLSIEERIKAVISTRTVDDREPCFFCGHEGPITYALSDFVAQSHDNKAEYFPSTIRCRKVGSEGCDQAGRSYWKHAERERTDYTKYHVECITDRFSNQVLLAESAFDVTTGFAGMGGVQRNWDEENRLNCLYDYVKVIEYTYQTVFWRIGTLII